MRRLTLVLDALPRLRESAAVADIDVAAAATLAQLAGADAVRLGVSDELQPVREHDVLAVRRAAQTFELRMAPTQTLVKVALEARPDRVLLSADGRDGGVPGPLDLRGRGVPLGPAVRALGEAGIPVTALVAPALDAVKAAHGEGVRGVELFTGTLVDLPAAELARELVTLADAVRLAAKLRLEVAVGGGLGFRSLREVLHPAPAAQRVAVGRAALARAMLVGIDRAVRDLRELLE